MTEAGTATAPKLNLRQKLHKVYEEIDHIEKGGWNDNQKYKFLRAADVVRKLRESFLKYGIWAETRFEYVSEHTIQTNKGGTMFSAIVKTIITLYDIDSDETKIIEGLGDGADSGDKGIYKAQTGAVKNALRNGFLIPDEADPEADETVDEATQPQQEKPKPKASKPAPSAQNAEDAETQKHAEAFFTNPAIQFPTADGPLPTDAELEGFRAKWKNLGETLSKAGLKPVRGVPVNRRILAYLVKISGQQDATTITKNQWTEFFKFVETLQKQENGTKQLIKLVEGK